MDANSKFINPSIDANGQPLPFSPAIRAGAYGAFQVLDEGAPLFDTFAASNVTGLAASATKDATNASNIVSGTLPAAQLPNPSASTLGGVQSGSASSNQFMTGINTSGVPQFAQPSASNISGLGSLAALNSLAATDLSDKTTAGTNMFTAATVAAQTALLNAMVGDSGSGGTAGLVPAPASGTAAAGKFLKADGTWSVPAGGGGSLTSPVAIGSATLLTTPVAGDLEYDGQAPYFSPIAGVRGVVPAFQHSHVTASGGVTLANVNTAQSFLPSGAQNFPVEAGVIYRFRAKILLNMNTTTTCVKNFLFAGKWGGLLLDRLPLQHGTSIQR